MPIWSTPSSAACNSLRSRLALGCIAVLTLVACEPPRLITETDVVVIGAGIAGLAAALEASEAGATVTLVDMNSVGGGHAVMAGGLFLVDTPLQRARGIEDSVELAVADMLAWGEDADAAWVQRYVEDSGTQVHDWLANLGVEFALILPAPGETSVPRFHFTRGTAVNVVVPMMRAALDRPTVDWRMNTEASAIDAGKNGGWTVSTRHLRTDARGEIRARAVVIATGGFEGNLARVRENWPAGVKAPETLLNGAGRFAIGSGLKLGAEAGAAIDRLNKQTIFVTGFPDPRDPSAEHGLLAMNPAAIYVNESGQRFMNEASSRKVLETTVLAMPGQTYWLIFDDRGRRRLQVRGAPWLDRESIDQEILGNPDIVQVADDPAALASAAGLPPNALALTVAAYNAQIVLGGADEFGRFGADPEAARPRALSEPPFYAMRLYPMTRKSLGGLLIDGQARVVDTTGKPMPGLHAAGEVTGVAGINGSHGGSGTFLGPSIYTGRIAGRTAAQHVGGPAQPAASAPLEPAAVNAPAAGPLLGAGELDALLAASRSGYWHFEQAHALVREREWACTECHDQSWGTQPATTAQEKRAQLESCARCH